MLRPSGQLFVVLPYPDAGQDNDLAHGGKHELGTHALDEGRAVIEFFRRNGFDLLDLHFDADREPEIWLTLVRSS